MQVAVNAVEQWSTINKLQLNADKCKELVIDFKKVKHHFDAVTVNSQELERVDSVKLLGVTITNTLQWNCHVLTCNPKGQQENILSSLQLHADLSVYFRNGHNRWILYPKGSIYSSGLSLREYSF